MSGDFPKTQTHAPSTISSCACESTSKKTRPSRGIFSLYAEWAIALSLSQSANISGAGFERIFARGCQTILLRFHEGQRAQRCDRWKAHHHKKPGPPTGGRGGRAGGHRQEREKKKTT